MKNLFMSAVLALAVAPSFASAASVDCSTIDVTFTPSASVRAGVLDVTFPGSFFVNGGVTDRDQTGQLVTTRLHSDATGSLDARTGTQLTFDNGSLTVNSDRGDGHASGTLIVNGQSMEVICTYQQ